MHQSIQKEDNPLEEWTKICTANWKIEGPNR